MYAIHRVICFLQFLSLSLCLFAVFFFFSFVFFPPITYVPTISITARIVEDDIIERRGRRRKEKEKKRRCSTSWPTAIFFLRVLGTHTHYRINPPSILISASTTNMTSRGEEEQHEDQQRYRSKAHVDQQTTWKKESTTAEKERERRAENVFLWHVRHDYWCMNEMMVSRSQQETQTRRRLKSDEDQEQYPLLPRYIRRKGLHCRIHRLLLSVLSYIFSIIEETNLLVKYITLVLFYDLLRVYRCTIVVFFLFHRLFFIISIAYALSRRVQVCSLCKCLLHSPRQSLPYSRQTGELPQ